MITGLAFIQNMPKMEVPNPQISMAHSQVIARHLLHSETVLFSFIIRCTYFLTYVE